MIGLFYQFVAALFVISAILGIGRLVCRKFSAAMNWQEQITLFYGVGFYILALLAGVLAYFGIFNRTPVFIVLLAGFFSGMLWVPDFLNRELLQRIKNLDRREKILAVLIVLMCGAMFAGAFAPVIAGDSLRGHLTVPEYILNHHEFPRGQYDYNNYFMMIYCVYAAVMALNPDAVPLFCFFSGMLNLIAVFMLMRVSVSRCTALAGTLLFLCMPITAFQFTSCYTDLFVEFFGILIVYWIMNRQKPGWVYCSGIFAALSLLSKLNALILITALAAAYVIIEHTQLKKEWKSAGVGMVICAVLCLPFFYKNVSYMHNPVWPYYNDFFNGKPVLSDKNPNYTGFYGEYGVQEMIVNGFWLPWDITIEQKKLMNSIAPFFLMTGLFSIGWFWRQQRMMVYIICSYCILFALLKTDSQNRYHYAFSIVLMTMAVKGIEILACSPRMKFFRNVGFGAVAMIVGMNALIITGMFAKEYKFAAGVIDKHRYLSETKRYYPLFQYLNDNHSSGILLIGVDEYYYLKKPAFFVHSGIVYNTDSAAVTTVPEFMNDFSNNLRDRNIRHVVFDETAYGRYENGENERFNDGIGYPELFESVKHFLQTEAKEIMRNGNYILYEI